jgi:myo-inositol-1(or 4)-monophosphatase
MNEPAILTVARETALKAGELIGRMQKKAWISAKKASNNLLTEADLESQKLIISAIRSVFPGHQYFAEEDDGGVADGCTADPVADNLWVIDPIDGTNNYASGIPLYSVSIAYAQRGVVQAGVVYDPSRKEVFCAERGKGAWLNDQRIHASERTTLQEAMLTTGFYYDRGQLMKRTLDKLYELLSMNIRGLLRTGSAAIDLAWIAAGRFDAFFEYDLAAWDYAAGMLLVAEAGGFTCDRYGNPLDLIGHKGVVAGNPHIFEQLRDIVKWRE